MSRNKTAISRTTNKKNNEIIIDTRDRYEMFINNNENIKLYLGDVNADGVIQISDVIYLINHINRLPGYEVLPYIPNPTDTQINYDIKGEFLNLDESTGYARIRIVNDGSTNITDYFDCICKTQNNAVLSSWLSSLITTDSTQNYYYYTNKL